MGRALCLKAAGKKSAISAAACEASSSATRVTMNQTLVATIVSGCGGRGGLGRKAVRSFRSSLRSRLGTAYWQNQEGDGGKREAGRVPHLAVPFIKALGAGDRAMTAVLLLAMRE